MAGASRATGIVAVVGAGPRGVVVAGRLLARLAAERADPSAPASPVEIHLVDEHPNGRVWPLDAPECLLMNSRADGVTLFSDEAMPDLPALPAGADFLTWLDGRPAGGHPGASGFATRRRFARYLEWARELVLRSDVRGVDVRHHRARVVGLGDGPHRRHRLRLRLPDGTACALDADVAVLALGHQPPVAGPRTARLVRRGARAGRFYCPPHAVTDVDLARALPGEPLAVLGTGLSFFDLMAALTQGRGGRFERGTDATVRYHASGAEPRLFVGSRRGVPHLSRAVRPGPVTLRFFDDEAVTALLGRAGPLDFRRDVWPLVHRDLVWAHAGIGDEPDLAAAYRRLDPGSPDAARLVEAATGAPPLDLARVLDPLAVDDVPVRFPDAAALTRRMVTLLDDDVRESRRHPRGRIRAAGEAMGAAAGGVRTLVAHGRVDGRSYRDDVEGWFTAMLAHLASGPPVARFEQLAALARAGLVTFVGGRVTLREDGDRFALDCPNLGREIPFDGAVEARLHVTDCRRSGDPLTADLVGTGRARAHRLPAAGGAAVELRALDVRRSDSALVSAAGTADPRTFVIGVPLEGMHWHTAALPQPRREDPTLRAADDIALATLRVLRAGAGA